MEKIYALILAGGRSSRMGRDKAVIDPVDPEGGKNRMIDRAVAFWRQSGKVSRVLVACGSREHGQALGLPEGVEPVYDIMDARGPMVGILSAFKFTDADVLYVSAVDMPNLSREAVLPLPQGDASIYVQDNGRYEPLFGVYRRSVVDAAEKELAFGKGTMAHLIEAVDTELFRIPPEFGNLFDNLNTPEELEKYRALKGDIGKDDGMQEGNADNGMQEKTADNEGVQDTMIDEKAEKAEKVQGALSYINEQYKDLPMTLGLLQRVITREGQVKDVEKEVLIEHLLDVYVNEILTMKLICSPDHLTELVLGRLFTEGMIRSTDDVEMIYICEYGSRARVMLKDAGRAPEKELSETSLRGKNVAGAQEDTAFVETTPSCCTGNHVLSDYFISDMPVEPVQPMEWKLDWIFQLADRFRQGMPVHNATASTHSCFLMHRGEIVFECEDIGRHNALDKAIGYALRNGLDTRECIAYSSGRVPTDMVMKAVRAGIPVLVSKARPTVEAVQLAEQYGLTLIGAARTDSVIQYTGL